MVGHLHRRPRECHPTQPGDTQAKAGLTKIDSDFLLPPPGTGLILIADTATGNFQNNLQLQPCLPSPHAPTDLPVPPTPTMPYAPASSTAPPAASIIWTGAEAFELLNQRIPPHHCSVWEYADEKENTQILIGG